MDIRKLLGMKVRNRKTHEIGSIVQIDKDIVTISFHGNVTNYKFPDIFSSIMEIEDEIFEAELEDIGKVTAFENFKHDFKTAILSEIGFLRTTGGKKYRIFDGDRLKQSKIDNLYNFDSDADINIPDNTAIKLWFLDKIVYGYILSCEEFTVMIRTMEYIGEHVETVEFTYDQTGLLETLSERLDEIERRDELAYEIACCGKKHATQWCGINRGQNQAFGRATTEPITFIWGPPGTGKTETLANIALEHINKGRRVLMLSYSNVLSMVLCSELQKELIYLQE